MRRTLLAGLTLALTLGVASVSQAQQHEHSKPDSAHHDGQMKRGEGGQRGPAMMLKGIELTDAQKAQIKALHEKQGRPAEMRREQREQMRAEMMAHHAKMVAEVRALLTPAQQEIFDKNVVEMKQRMEKRQENMQHRRQKQNKS